MNIMCFNRDSCAANGVATRALINTFTAADDILCICHTLNNAGEHFVFALVLAFMSVWVKLIYGTSAAKAVWRDLINESVVGYSTVRWFALAEIMF
jgi:hypothetical protein